MVLPEPRKPVRIVIGIGVGGWIVMLFLLLFLGRSVGGVVMGRLDEICLGSKSLMMNAMNNWSAWIIDVYTSFFLS